MIILGIDPGSRVTGFGVVELLGKKISYIDSGILNFSESNGFIDRLGLINKEVKILVEKYLPEEISIESLIYVKNISSLAKLAQARGAMIGAIQLHFKNKIFEYAPNLIKSTVSGHGHSSKESVVNMLDLVFGEITYKTHDQSDALAIALCHALLRTKTSFASRDYIEKKNPSSMSGALRNNKKVLEKLRNL